MGANKWIREAEIAIGKIFDYMLHYCNEHHLQAEHNRVLRNIRDWTMTDADKYGNIFILSQHRTKFRDAICNLCLNKIVDVYLMLEEARAFYKK